MKMTKKMKQQNKEEKISFIKKNNNIIRRSVLGVGIVLMVSGLFVIGSYWHAEETKYLYITSDMAPPSPSTFVDIRTYHQYNESHIPGAISIPNQCPSCFLNEISRLDHDHAYILYGNHSATAAEIMHSEGFTSLYILIDYQNKFPTE